jgi:Holliday junction resolvase RusA-like endonuclease
MGENRDIEFIIYGEPMGKQRPKVSVRNGYPHAYTPKETILYENKVAFAYKEVANEFIYDRGDLLSVTINAYFPLNKGDYGKKGLNKSGKTKLERIFCDKKPDLDNAIKSILDGLNGIAYYDDKQVVQISATKMWTQEQPRVQVILSKLN